MLKLLGFILSLMLYSCSQVSPRQNTSDLVSVDAALNQARSSYLKGCVDAYHEVKIPKPFSDCLNKARVHQQQLLEIMDQQPALP
jgi:hypothetical protein